MRAAYTGLNARSTPGRSKTCSRPMMPRNENHTSITGPNALPILLVPAHCTAKSVLMMTRVIRTTCACPLPRKRFIAGMLRRPSTAVVTVTAGVRTPSARSAAPPIIAGKMSQGATFFTSAYSENMPPSPLLSARMAMSTYLTVVSSVIVQMMSESAPRIKSSFTCAMPPLPLRIDFITYSGDVPMSPYTMPIVTRNIPKLTLFFFSMAIPTLSFGDKNAAAAQADAARSISALCKNTLAFSLHDIKKN